LISFLCIIMLCLKKSNTIIRVEPKV
jgi:hypothetical protein